MSGECVKVVVRCRPMNQREKDLKCDVIVQMDESKNQVLLKCLDEPKSPPKQFTFDGAYYLQSQTETLYNDVGFQLVESVCEGYNGTVFAYGQTGCGKSFTMQGIKDVAAQKGIIPRAFEHIFEAVATDTTKKFLIRASYLEIYNENIRDLLGKDFKQTLEMHEHVDKGVYVSNLSMHECKQVSDCEKLMDKGNKNRSTGATLMNADSSRSHSIFAISVEMCEKDEQGKEHYRVGKLNLVDLAGSERQAKTGATGDRLKEATKINLSLSALGNVISALVDGRSKHVPYRDSKLTRLLQDSLGGNTKTLMIAAISPAGDNYEETLSTLRYANRAKNIKNKPIINEDPKDAKLRQLQEEINLLKAQLAGQAPMAVPDKAKSQRSSSQLDDEKNRLRLEYEQQIADINNKYEEEKMSKEALSKEIENIKKDYDDKMGQLNQTANDQDDFINPTHTQMTRAKSARGNRKMSASLKRASLISSADASDNANVDTDKALMLHEMEQMIVGGEQANNEELKKKRNKRKKQAEERKRQLAEFVEHMRNNGNYDDGGEYMLNVFNNVQEEVKYKTELYEREKKNNIMLNNEIKDLQREFERDREDFLDAIRKHERQIKLLNKLLYRLQPIIPSDCNYSNLDRVQATSQWIEEAEDWKLPDMKFEKLSLPTMSNGSAGKDGRITAKLTANAMADLANMTSDEESNPNSDTIYLNNDASIQIPRPQAILQARRLLSSKGVRREKTFMMIGSGAPGSTASGSDIGQGLGNIEPEIDRYRIKLENSQHDSSNYFKGKRQSQLLNQTQDMRNASGQQLSPLNSSSLQRNRRPY